jgi:hypothetical protein
MGGMPTTNQGSGRTGGRRREGTRAVVAYLVASAVCLVVSRIYLAHSHGLTSVYMSALWAWPLVLGAGVAAVWTLLDIGRLSTLGTVSWRCLVATLTLGSFVRGVLDIADATSPYLFVYDLAAAVLFVLAAGSAVRAIGRRHRGAETLR